MNEKKKLEIIELCESMSTDNDTVNALVESYEEENLTHCASVKELFASLNEDI